MRRSKRVEWITMALVVSSGCWSASPTPALNRAENSYQECLDWRDRHAVTVARGESHDPEGIAVEELAVRFREAKKRTAALLREAATAASEEDRLAIGVMEETLSRWPDEEEAGQDLGAGSPCDFSKLRESDGEAALRELKAALYRCFSQVNGALDLEGERVDRLTLLGRLAGSRDAEARRRAFEALQPLWRAVNRDNRPDSPYRRLIRLSSEELTRRGTTVQAKAAGPLGLRSESVEEWLVAILEKWNRVAPPGEIEPWDVWSPGGEAGGWLDGMIPLDSLRRINDAFYREMGAEPVSLGLVYDLSPRPGKTPVAFTDFGRRNRRRDGVWEQGAFWIFATYREGGLGNLFELLHETGHGVHIASIRTRPAFMDWPDSDVFTEGLADLAALEVYEPNWQRRFLGEAAPLQASIRSKYASIALDAAWGLFEIRMHGDPASDPNQIWNGIMSRYFNVRAHPEWSWWALRGQLVDSPGYMLNYGVGAILIADIRAKARDRFGPFLDNPKWLSKVEGALYRFGRERPSSQVLRDFLGREPSPAALLLDMDRAAR